MATPLVRKPPHRPITPGLPLFAAALGAALVGASLAYLLQPELAGLPAGDAAGMRSEALAPVAMPAPRPTWLQPPPVGTPLPTLAELQELKASLAHGPGPTADFARVGEQVLFADTSRLFAALAAQPGDGGELRAAAALLYELLQARAQRGELAPDESRAMQSQLQSLLLQAQRTAPVSAR